MFSISCTSRQFSLVFHFDNKLIERGYHGMNFSTTTTILMCGFLTPTFSMAPGSGGKSWLTGAYCYDGTICTKKDDHDRGIHSVPHFVVFFDNVILFCEYQIRALLVVHSHVKYFDRALLFIVFWNFYSPICQCSWILFQTNKQTLQHSACKM